MSPAPSSRFRSRRKRSPAAKRTNSSRKLPMRIFGPCRSARMPTYCPTISACLRTRRATRACCSAVPWLKLSRKTFTPAPISLLSMSSDSLAGPIVATIFVRLITLGVTLLSVVIRAALYLRRGWNASSGVSPPLCSCPLLPPVEVADHKVGEIREDTVHADIAKQQFEQVLEAGHAGRQIVLAQGVGMNQQSARLRLRHEVGHLRRAAGAPALINVRQPGADAVGIGGDFVQPRRTAQVVVVDCAIFTPGVVSYQLNQWQWCLQPGAQVAQRLVIKTLQKDLLGPLCIAGIAQYTAHFASHIQACGA